MPRTSSNDYDYIEWDEADTAAVKARARGDRAPAVSLFDAEIRRRFGEMIARAALEVTTLPKKKIHKTENSPNYVVDTTIPLM